MALGMESWRQLANPRDLAKQFDATDYMAWRTFRDSNDLARQERFQ